MLIVYRFDIELKFDYENKTNTLQQTDLSFVDDDDDDDDDDHDDDHDDDDDDDDDDTVNNEYNHPTMMNTEYFSMSIFQR
jgi:hypothetical protein